MADPDARQRMVEALCAPELAPIVDLVVWVEDDEPYGANHLGTVRFRYGGPAELVSGTNPIGSEDPLAFLPYDAELANPSPRISTENAYPLAWQRLRSFFADPDRSPDLAIVHTPRHFFPDEGGHVGEHGSLDVIQSRAPLILSGAGIPRRGYVDAHARLVDVGPTLAFLAGVPAMDLVDAEGRALDGRVLREHLEQGGTRRHVIGMLWDGAHCGDLLHLAQTGELPGVARLIETRAGAAGRRRRGVPVDHADQPHLDPDRHRAGPARRDGQRLLRPGHGRAGRPQRPVDLAPQRRLAPPRGPHHLRDGRQALARGRRRGPDSLRRRGDRPRRRLRDDGADPRVGTERGRRPRRVSARPDHVGVPAQSRVPRRLLLPVGGPRRRPRPDPDARPVRHARPRRRC